MIRNTTFTVPALALALSASACHPPGGDTGAGGDAAAGGGAGTSGNDGAATDGDAPPDGATHGACTETGFEPCEPGDRDCFGDIPLGCGRDGVWRELPQCAGDTPLCHAGACIARPQCAVDVSRYSHVCAVRADGSTWCWGDDTDGTLGVVGPSKPGYRRGDRFVPAPSPVLARGWSAADVEVGGSYTCARATTGEMRCWGANSRGQLGDGTTEDRTRPVRVEGMSEGVTAIELGYGRIYAVHEDGMVWYWGAYDDEDPNPTPRPVAGLGGDFTAVAFSSQVCGLRQDGTVWCWGSAWCQGDQSPRPARAPYQVCGFDGPVVEIAEFAKVDYWDDAPIIGHVFRTAGGRLWIWTGCGDWATPQPYATFGTDVASMSDYGGHGCVVKTDGSVWCVGRNEYGQRGGSPYPLPSSCRDASTGGWLPCPNRVDGLPPALQVVTGGEGTCALTMSGEVWCWGADNLGQNGGDIEHRTDCRLGTTPVGVPCHRVAVKVELPCP